MVKRLSTALVCGIALIAQSYAQEIFVGNQKAKPKYPKAEVVKADHTKAIGPVEKAIAVQPDKTSAGPKASSATKSSVVSKQDTPVQSATKGSLTARGPATKPVASALS